MNIVIDQSSTSDSNTRLSDTRIDDLWKTLQEKQKQHQEIKADAESLLELYQQKLLPVEQELVQPLALLAARLIDFANRKSLSNWHRDELDVWIHELVTIIYHFDSSLAEDPKEQYKQSIAFLHGMTVEDLEAEFLASMALEEEALIDEAEAAFADFGPDAPFQDEQAAPPLRKTCSASLKRISNRRSTICLKSLAQTGTMTPSTSRI